MGNTTVISTERTNTAAATKKAHCKYTGTSFYNHMARRGSWDPVDAADDAFRANGDGTARFYIIAVPHPLTEGYKMAQANTHPVTFCDYMYAPCLTAPVKKEQTERPWLCGIKRITPTRNDDDLILNLVPIAPLEEGVVNNRALGLLLSHSGLFPNLKSWKHLPKSLKYEETFLRLSELLCMESGEVATPSFDDLCEQGIKKVVAGELTFDQLLSCFIFKTEDEKLAEATSKLRAQQAENAGVGTSTGGNRSSAAKTGKAGQQQRNKLAAILQDLRANG